MERGADLDRWLTAISGCRRVALDTNAVIYTLQGVYPYSELLRHLFELLDRGLMTALVSTIVEAEVLVKPLRERDAHALEMTQLFFLRAPNLSVRIVDRTVSAAAASIRANTGLRLPDALIAATAAVDRCDAIIGNDRAVARHQLGVPYLYLDDYLS